MKKLRIVSFILACVISLSCVNPMAAASESAAPTASLEVETAEPSMSSAESSLSEVTVPAASNGQTTLVSTLPGGLHSVSETVVSNGATEPYSPVDALGALLVDVNSRTVLYAQDADKVVYPASTVKIMTALLVFDAIDAGTLSMSDEVTVGEEYNIGTTGNKFSLQMGEVLTVDQLLHCLLIPSMDEAANTLAVAVSGSVPDFVERMNQKAVELGCSNTHFTNTHGIQNTDQYTTCYDMYLISEAACAYPKLIEIAGAGAYQLDATNLSEARSYSNTNLLVSSQQSSGYHYTYATGLKYGNSYQARSCLIGTALYKDRTLVAIVMGSQDYINESGTVIRPVYGQVSDLFRYGYNQFEALTLCDKGEMVGQVDVPFGKGVDYVLAATAEAATIPLVSGLTKEDFIWETHLPDKVDAPVSAGDEIGTMDLCYNGQVYGTVKLVAVSDVAVSVGEQFKAGVAAFFGNPLVIVIMVLLGLGALFFIGLMVSSIVIRSRSRKKRRNSRVRRSLSSKTHTSKKKRSSKSSKKV